MRGESFAEAAVRGLVEELGIGEKEAAEAVRRGGGEGEETGGGEAGYSSASAFSYPSLPCRYEMRLFVAEIDGDLLPSETFFEREESTPRGMLVTRWQWVGKEK